MGLFKIKFILTLFFLITSTVLAKEDAVMTLKKSLNIKDVAPHSAIKVSHFYEKNLFSRVELVFLNENEMKLTMLGPEKLEGIISGANGKELIYYVPKMRVKMVFPLNKTEFGPQEIMGTNVSFSNLGKNYKITFVKKERVIGRDCNVIKVESKYPPKRTKIVWIDEKTNVGLKEEKYYGDKLYNSFICEKISYSVPTKEELEMDIGISLTAPTPDREEYKSLEDAKANCSWKFGYPSYMSEGFYLEKIRIRKSIIGDEVVLYFTDGLSRIDITQKKKSAIDIIADKIIALTEFFYIYSAGEKIPKETKDVKIHIYGEFPKQELEKILNSMSFNK